MRLHTTFAAPGLAPLRHAGALLGTMPTRADQQRYALLASRLGLQASLLTNTN
jgi:hypothetical protein